MKRLIATVVLLAALPSFAQEAKNVKYLTGLTPLEMQRTMNFMRASLGVNCSYCHVLSPEGKWDWASDEKKEKQTARSMIAMTIDLNKNNFNRPVISCNTCHRGAVRPESAIPLPQHPPEDKPAVERPTPPPTKDVIGRYAAAIGDASRLSAWRAKGVRIGWDNKETPFELTLRGTDVHVHGITPQGMEVDQYVTGSGSWIRSKEGVKAMRAPDEQNIRMLTEAFAFVAPNDIPEETRVWRQDTIDGRPVWVADAPLRPGWRQRFFFDAASGLLVRRTLYMRTSIGDVPTQVDYSDYRDAGGVKVPFAVRVSLVDPWVSAARRYEQVTTAAKIDDAELAMPKDLAPPPR